MSSVPVVSISVGLSSHFGYYVGVVPIELEQIGALVEYPALPIVLGMAVPMEEALFPSSPPWDSCWPIRETCRRGVQVITTPVAV